jgi:hypothetical protein
MLTVVDALATLARSSVPSVITEGYSDYRALRKLEEKLSDIDVSFLPLSGKTTVLEVWRSLPPNRLDNTVALVDLDCWLYYGIPDQYIADNLIFTCGYSIENDISLDYNFEDLMDNHERASFQLDLSHVALVHARLIEAGRPHGSCEIGAHPNQILGGMQVVDPSEEEAVLHNTLVQRHRQLVRGHTLMALYARQLSRPNRPVKFGRRQLLEIGSAVLGPSLLEIEAKIRAALTG